MNRHFDPTNLISTNEALCENVVQLLLRFSGNFFSRLQQSSVVQSYDRKKINCCKIQENFTLLKFSMKCFNFSYDFLLLLKIIKYYKL